MPGDIFRKDVQFIKGVGPQRQKLLHKIGVRSVGDLLYYFPRSYEDRSQVRPISELRRGERATIRARVERVEVFRVGPWRTMAHVHFRDQTGTIVAVWFRTRYFRPERFSAGKEMYVSGRVVYYEKARRLQFVSPQCEPTEPEPGQAAFGASIVPVYPLREELSQWLLRRIMRQAVTDYADALPERLPEAIRRERRLLPVAEAVRNIHFPQSAAAAAAARRRLVYEEFFFLQLALALRRQGIQQAPGYAFVVTPKIDQRIRALFPFTLTRAQEKAIAEIAADMQRPVPMNRLLQGDVGSGKTVVALYALLVAVANRKQAAIMAPTEILAEQHYERFRQYLAKSRVRMALLRGGASRAERRELLRRIANGDVDLTVGTHALIEEDVGFERLGAVVVDEQHKFGVMQRFRLPLKGKRPHVLVMTATPIPRTLALTVFGDLDVSTLDEMPPGRRPPTTRWVRRSDVPKMWEFVRERLRLGEQAFVVYPLVEESDALMNMRAATQQVQYLQEQVFPEFNVGLLHGRMSAEEKQAVMERFRASGIQVLVATIVVEVGIDVPNATVMVVEHAEQFGLATLHQLRGRIGRGDKPAWFFLLGEPKSEEAHMRLRVIASTNDGFRIAEEDLRLRGPGEFLGTRQHGLPEWSLADPAQDYPLLRLARADAFQLVAQDGSLSRPEHASLREWFNAHYGDRARLIEVA